jgi:hypothetical protein
MLQKNEQQLHVYSLNTHQPIEREENGATSGTQF